MHHRCKIVLTKNFSPKTYVPKANFDASLFVSKFVGALLGLKNSVLSGNGSMTVIFPHRSKKNSTTTLPLCLLVILAELRRVETTTQESFQQSQQIQCPSFSNIKVPKIIIKLLASKRSWVSRSCGSKRFQPL